MSFYLLNQSAPPPGVQQNVHQKQFISYLVSPPKDKRAKLNVTPFQKRLERFLKGCDEYGFASLQAVHDNGERITRFKRDGGDKLKGLLMGCLTGPLLLQMNEQCLEFTNLLKKSEILSDELRGEGNKFYGKRKMDEALRCYTLACCYAPSGSKSAALAYSNRSACFFGLNQFKRALQDIEKFEEIAKDWSEEADVRIAEKVAERKTKCVNSAEEEEEKRPVDKEDLVNDDGKADLKLPKELFKLPDTNLCVPAARDFIGILDDEARGRHVCNISEVKDIQPGTLIILEQPYAKALLGMYSFEAKNCSHCLKDLAGGGIPCKECVFALYCSKECEAASNLLHSKYECKIAHYLYELNMNRTVYLSLNILLKLGPEGLVNHMRSQRSMKKRTSLILGFSSEGIYDSNSYDTIYNLIYHNKILSENELRKYCSDALVITEIVDHGTDYFDSISECPLEKPLFKDYFATLILLHQMNLPCNAHSLYKLDLTNTKNPSSSEILNSSIEEIGAGAFSLLSMINHSCDPNVVRVTLPQGLNAVFAIKTIRPGEEILDNYGSHYVTDPVQSRKSHLLETYNFVCNCTPCRENWPMFQQLDQMVDEDGVRLCSDCSFTVKPNAVTLEDEGQLKMKCPSCKKIFLKSDIMEELRTFAEKFEGAKNMLLENKVKPALHESIACLTYFDNHFLKPYKYIGNCQEVMKQSMFLIAKRMFSDI